MSARVARNVKAWRSRFRARVRAALGGKCVCCGYDKCDAALAVHHIDPTKKDFSLNKILANPKSAAGLAKELAKCVLVCMNCHAEIHYGKRDNPTESSFNKQLYLFLILEPSSSG